MNDYIIGAGALLTAGPRGGLAPATFHVQASAALAGSVRAAAFDFEGTRPDALHRLLLLAPGWNARNFEERVSSKLRRCGEASLAQVLAQLGWAVGTQVVHLFAGWLPDARMVDEASAMGVDIVAHPLEAVGQASLVHETRLSFRPFTGCRRTIPRKWKR